jgi:hypothetical protein
LRYEEGEDRSEDEDAYHHYDLDHPQELDEYPWNRGTSTGTSYHSGRQFFSRC